MVTDVEVLRLHYAETLKEWRLRFKAHWREAAELYDERFCRMWEFYLAGAEMAFRHEGLVVFQIQLAKRIDTLPHHARLHARIRADDAIRRRRSDAAAKPRRRIPTHRSASLIAVGNDARRLAVTHLHR